MSTPSPEEEEVVVRVLLQCVEAAVGYSSSVPETIEREKVVDTLQLSDCNNAKVVSVLTRRVPLVSKNTNSSSDVTQSQLEKKVETHYDSVQNEVILNGSVQAFATRLTDEVEKTIQEDATLPPQRCERRQAQLGNDGKYVVVVLRAFSHSSKLHEQHVAEERVNRYSSNLDSANRGQEVELGLTSSVGGTVGEVSNTTRENLGHRSNESCTLQWDQVVNEELPEAGLQAGAHKDLKAQQQSLDCEVLLKETPGHGEEDATRGEELADVARALSAESCTASSGEKTNKQGKSKRVWFPADGEKLIDIRYFCYTSDGGPAQPDGSNILEGGAALKEGRKTQIGTDWEATRNLTYDFDLPLEEGGCGEEWHIFEEKIGQLAEPEWAAVGLLWRDLYGKGAMRREEKSIRAAELEAEIALRKRCATSP
ncbi:hypothetical protein CYMTET_41542 [Cymbomonas tetramitiformis]|uniref:Uncharacterized protein n=1 Tax=Cymbomonas tetramitiformis TaxID=36881 RepID=A0AAE0C7C4_9CHLO|nr:hypothetical protein CYMTET_41542 [Cymbomonas tetramitiformis]